MKRILLFVVALVVIFAGSAFSQMPRVINYQGILLGMDEKPVPDGQYQLTFKIYDDANNLLWTEIHSPVFIGNGLFQVILGTNTPLALAFERPYFLGIQVGADPELQPRMPLTSAAYSMRAQDANNLTGMSNLVPSDGNVGFGTTNPQQKLHVAGIGRFDVSPNSHIDISTPGGWPGLITLTPQAHRRDIIFDDPDPGSGYKGGIRLLTSTSSSAAPATNGITITEEGNVGIGTSAAGQAHRRRDHPVHQWRIALSGWNHADDGGYGRNWRCWLDSGRGQQPSRADQHRG